MVNPALSLQTRPKRVALMGLGASRTEYGDYIVQQKGAAPFDEIWTVNMGLDIYRHDKVFVMDDLRVQSRKWPTYGQRLALHDKPIITSAVYPEYPMAVRFPIEDVIKAIGDDLFTNTVCYSIAYAMVTGVKDLYIYGCDFWYPNCDLREEGGMNAAYLLGLCRFFGLNFHLPETTTLLSAHRYKEGGRPLYGYAVQPFAKTKFDYSEHQINEGEVPGDANPTPNPNESEASGARPAGNPPLQQGAERDGAAAHRRDAGAPPAKRKRRAARLRPAR